MKTPDHIANAHYQRAYCISLSEAEAMFASQGNLCAICGRPTRRRLDVDHDHKIEKAPITIERTEDGFVGRAFHLVVECTNKAFARAAIRMKLLRWSVRGGLCHRCNRGLQMFGDNPERLRNAANYLDNPVHPIVP